MLLAGEITSCGAQMLADYLAPYTATCCQKLIDQGALLIGKTNMDEFAMGSSTEHSYFGVSKNPYGKDRIPGGSSGGSAVALATGQCLAALGTDTGGSIRQPASLCGVIGFKPSYGKISRYGVQSLASSLDQVGTFTHTVADAKLLLQLLAGKDENDLTTQDYETQTTRAPSKRLAVPHQIFTTALDPQVEQLFRNKLEELRGQGFQIDFVDVPLLKHAGALYAILMSAELSSNLGRFDGLRFGLQIPHQDYVQIRSEAFGKEVKKRLMLGNYVLLHEQYNTYYQPALQARKLLAQQCARLFEQYDAILTPTTPAPASKIGAKTTDSLKMYLEDLYTTPANLAGLPAISLPMGQVKEGEENLPVGLHLMGARGADEALLDLAEIIALK